jgi:hypothetical protein
MALMYDEPIPKLSWTRATNYQYFFAVDALVKLGVIFMKIIRQKAFITLGNVGLYKLIEIEIGLHILLV